MAKENRFRTNIILNDNIIITEQSQNIGTIYRQYRSKYQKVGTKPPLTHVSQNMYIRD